jgi:hypothetical protein
MMIVEKQIECRLAGETEVLGENLPQRHFCPSPKSHMMRPGFEPGPPRWEAGDYPPELWCGLVYILTETCGFTPRAYFFFTSLLFKGKNLFILGLNDKTNNTEYPAALCR